MTVLRKQAYDILEHLPEKSLQYIIQIMQGIDGLYNNNVIEDKRREAYNELVSMIEPLGDIDEQAELEQYRKEKYGL